MSSGLAVSKPKGNATGQKPSQKSSLKLASSVLPWTKRVHQQLEEEPEEQEQEQDHVPIPKKPKLAIAVKPTTAPTAGKEVERTCDSIAFELSSKRRVTVRKWKSSLLVDLREFYLVDQVAKPGKKGVSLTRDQWDTLVDLSKAIDQAIDCVEDDRVDAFHHEKRIETHDQNRNEPEIALELSPKRRVSVRSFRKQVMVDVREFYEQNGVWKPGNKGLALQKAQWRTLQELMPTLDHELDELEQH